MKKDRFLIVGHDIAFVRGVTEVMERYRECEVVEAGSLDVAAGHILEEQFALVFVDLPAVDLCSPACSSFGFLLGESIPVVVFVDPNSCPVLAIQVGFLPNEYLMKPFRLGTLLDRVNYLLPNDSITSQAPCVIGQFTFIPLKSLLKNMSTGASIRLTEKETLILKMLYSAGTQSVSRESLLKQGWGYQTSIPTHTLETHVYRLRKKLQEANGTGEVLVKTTQGYKLNLDNAVN